MTRKKGTKKDTKSGDTYRDFVYEHIREKFGPRGVKVYIEIRKFGRTPMGKERKIDLLVIFNDLAGVVSCKYQSSSGTVEEKVAYALEDVESLNGISSKLNACVAYCGDGGFSEGCNNYLRGKPLAVYCSKDNTKELDYRIAMWFGFWDLIAK